MCPVDFKLDSSAAKRPQAESVESALRVSLVELPSSAPEGTGPKEQSGISVRIDATGEEIVFPLGQLGESRKLAIRRTRANTYLGRGIRPQKEVLEVDKLTGDLPERLLSVCFYYEDDLEQNPAFARVSVLQGMPVSQTVALKAKSRTIP
jgi:hypothetical protein